MYSLEEINQVEQQYTTGKPSLGRALDMLLARWDAQERDEDTALRLLLLLWYASVEPPYLTGLEVEAAGPVFRRVFEEAGGEPDASPLILYAVGKMAEMFPWAIGDEREWAAKAVRLMEKSTAAQPDISPETFAGRGAAGEYFQDIMTS